MADEGVKPARGAQARLFVAAELPEPVAAALHAWGAEITGRDPGLRAMPASSLHVTLCFLGSQPADDLTAIAAACSCVASQAAVTLTVGEALWLPRHRPRVLAIALDDAQERLAAVQAQLARELVSGGWYLPERRPFLAHVTVARVRHGARVGAVELPAPEARPAAIEHVTLFRSHLSTSGGRYEALARVPLAPGAS